MQRLILVAAAAGAAALIVGGLGWRNVQSATVATPAEIAVVADGAVHAAPDTARLWIGVEVFGPALGAADREADQRIASVLAVLRSSGIPDAHIRTVGVTISPQYTGQNGDVQQLSGYISRSMVEIETSDLSGLPALIDSAMGAGANRVELIQFESDSLDQLRSQARDSAWQSARREAEQLAGRAGVRLDRVVSVDEPAVEQSTTIRPDQNPVYVAGQPVTRASMASGEVEVRTRLHVVWSTQ